MPLPPEPITEERVDVVVIGAGIGGLHAARLLHQQDRTVSVLERRDRIGGRLHTVESAGTPVDLGATWFWPQERAVNKVVAEHGLRVHPQHLGGDAIYHDRPHTKRIEGNPLDVPSGRFTDGAQALAEAEAALLPEGVIRLEQSATGIELLADAVRVTTTLGAVVAKHVVVALPPALATTDLAFTPPLDAMVASVAAATPVWMGTTTKVVVRFAEPFWRRHGLSGSGISHLGPIRELHDMSGPDGESAALFGFAPQRPEGPVTTAEVLAQFAELFPGHPEPLAVELADWSTQRATSAPETLPLGDYATYGHRAFQTPSYDGRLHWASTETAPDNPGHIDGALLAARRAVAAILEPSESERTHP